MKIKKIQLITEAGFSKAKNIEFLNNTEDQFPYIEAAISSLDSNLNWWKENWSTIESDLLSAYGKSASTAMSISGNVKVRTRFTIYNGTDDVVSSVKWTGPAIEYTFLNADNKAMQEMKNNIGNILKGHKVIVEGNKVIILFG